MAWIAGSTCRSEINHARPECNNRPHPKNKEDEEADHAEASIRQRTARTEETAAPMRRMPVEILFSDRSALPAAQALVNGSAWGARFKFDLAERSLVVRHVLLQERHERLGLLRAQINPLKVS